MSVYHEVVNDLVSLYQSKRTLFLTEGDCVLHLNTLIKNVLDATQEVHSELRPWISDSDEVIRGDQWDKLYRVNYAAKVDLAVTDPEYFPVAYNKILEIQGKSDQLKYWRILLYPLKAFKAVFEVKVRVRGNKRRIDKDFSKLGLLFSKHKNCDYYIIVLDRSATKRQLRRIEKDNSKHIYVNYALANNSDTFSNMMLARPCARNTE